MAKPLPYWAAFDNVIHVDFPQHNPDALKDLMQEIINYAFPSYDQVMGIPHADNALIQKLVKEHEDGKEAPQA